MADVYFLKDNEGTSQCERAMEIDLTEIVSKFGATSIKFLSKDNVTIHNEEPSKWNRRVIVFVKDSEIQVSPTTKTGFHILDGVLMESFKKKILL